MSGKMGYIPSHARAYVRLCQHVAPILADFIRIMDATSAPHPVFARLLGAYKYFLGVIVCSDVSPHAPLGRVIPINSRSLIEKSAITLLGIARSARHWFGKRKNQAECARWAGIKQALFPVAAQFADPEHYMRVHTWLLIAKRREVGHDVTRKITRLLMPVWTPALHYGAWDLIRTK